GRQPNGYDLWHRHLPGVGWTGAARRLSKHDACARGAEAAAPARAGSGTSHDWWIGSDQLWHVGIVAGIRTGVVSAGGTRICALSKRLLVLCRALGLDLGRRCPLGFCAKPLRALDREQ